MRRKIALYLHIPFCKRKCIYCDFPSFAGKEGLILDYLSALTTELQMILGPKEAGDYHIDTVFFGGGTPSLLSGEEVELLLGKVRELTEVLPEAEISMEANPGTVTAEKLEKWRRAGVNRLSIGAQCGEDRLLKVLGRIHTTQEVEDITLLARQAGFDNLNLDLIFGLPGQSLTDWAATLRWAKDLCPEHLTCYGLQVEAGTPLAAMVGEGAVALPGDEETGAMYELAMDFLPACTYQQYEIASYARPGFECRHNLYYWRYHDYFGVGAGAYSTVSGVRLDNISLPEEYICRLKAGRTPVAHEEHLDHGQEMAEMIMLGLRLNEGPDAKDFYERWQVTLESVLREQAAPLLEAGFLEFNNGTYTLTRRGRVVSNLVLQRLLEPLL